MKTTIAGGGAPGPDSASGSEVTTIAEHAGDLKQIASGSSINLLGSITRNALTFVYAILLAAFLQPESVGYFFLGLTVMTLLATAATLGLDTGVVRFTALYEGEGDAGRVRGVVAGATGIVVVSALAIAISLFVAADAVADGVFGKPALGPILKLFSLGIPLYVLARLFNAATQGLRRMRYQVYSRDFAEQLTRILFSTVLLIGGLGVAGAVGANIAALALALALSLLFLQRVEPVFSRSRVRVYEQRRLLRYSIPLAVSTLVSFFLLWTDTLFLGRFQDAETVGIYSVAVRLAAVGSVIIVSFNTIFAPLAADFFNRRQRDRLESLLQSTNKWVLCFSLPIFSALILVPGEILGIIGEPYAGAATALAILAVGQLVNAAAGPVALLLMMCGRPLVVLFSNLLVLAADIVLCIVMIPAYGQEGAALAAAATLILFNVGALIGVVALLRLNPFSGGYMKCAAAGLFAMSLAYGLLKIMPGIWGVAAATGAFMATFVTSVLLTAFDESDALLIGAIRSRIFRRPSTPEHGNLEI